jgi:hypothetical protein
MLVEVVLDRFVGQSSAIDALTLPRMTASRKAEVVSCRLFVINPPIACRGPE